MEIPTLLGLGLGQKRDTMEGIGLPPSAAWVGSLYLGPLASVGGSPCCPPLPEYPEVRVYVVDMTKHPPTRF